MMTGSLLVRGILQAILNGDTGATNNAVFTALGLSQSTTVSSGFGISLYCSLHKSTYAGFNTPGSEPSVTEWSNYARTRVLRAGSDTTYGTAGNPSSNIKWTVAAHSSGVGYVATNVDPITFTQMSSGTGFTATHWGLWDAATGGNMLFTGPCIKSGATWKSGVFTQAPNTDQMFSRAHGFTSPGDIGDTLAVCALYNDWPDNQILGVLGSSLILTPNTISAIPGVDEITLGTTVSSTNGGVLFIETSPQAVSTGGIVSFPAGALSIMVA